jgi:hypothetical protein
MCASPVFAGDVPAFHRERRRIAIGIWIETRSQTIVIETRSIIFLSQRVPQAVCGTHQVVFSLFIKIFTFL